MPGDSLVSKTRSSLLRKQNLIKATVVLGDDES